MFATLIWAGSGIAGTFITLGLFPQIATVPVKGFIRMLGIGSEPRIVFGEYSAKSDDSRVPYRTWYHLSAVNEARPGWRGKLSHTEDAFECHATLEFRPTSGDGNVFQDDATITLGAKSAAVATLFVGKPFSIPLFWVGKLPNLTHPHPSGVVVTPGVYATGETWFYHPDLVDEWRLSPEIYLVTVRVWWNRRPFEHTFELPVARYL